MCNLFSTFNKVFDLYISSSSSGWLRPKIHHTSVMTVTSAITVIKCVYMCVCACIPSWWTHTGQSHKSTQTKQKRTHMRASAHDFFFFLAPSRDRCLLMRKNCEMAQRGWRAHYRKSTTLSRCLCIATNKKNLNEDSDRERDREHETNSRMNNKRIELLNFSYTVS